MGRRPAAWGIVAILAVLIYLPWIGQRSLWFPDELDVAEPALTMYRSGDWVVPRQNDDPWLDYPPVTYWLGAASSHLSGGPSPFALRLPIALIGVLLVALTARTAQLLAGWHTGLWCGIALATAPHFATQAVFYQPDMPFAALVAGGIATYAWGAGREVGWRAAAFKVVGFACFGAAVLAKGPLGLLMPGLILTVWHASQRQWRAVLWLAPLGLVSLAVAAPWYWELVRATSWEFVRSEVYLQNLARFGAANRGHEQPWWYYPSRIWFDYAPWSLLLPPALVLACREWQKPFVRLALLWFLITIVFLSLAATKREVYLLPAYPAIAFLIGNYVALTTGQDPRHRPRWFVATTGVFVVAGGVIALVVPMLTGVAQARAPEWSLPLIDHLAVPLSVMGVGVCLCGIGLLVVARTGQYQRGLALTVITLLFIYTVAFALVLPRLDEAKSYRAAATWLRERSGGEPIGFYPRDIDTKRAGFRVEDPAFMPLRMLASPREVADYLTRSSRVVVLDPDRREEIAAVVPDWESLPQREFQIGSRRFLALGPRVAEAAR